MRHATIGLGLAAGLVVSIGVYAFGQSTLPISCIAIVGLGIPCWILRRHYRTIANVSRAASLGWRYGLASGIICYVVVAINVIAVSGEYLPLVLLGLLIGCLPFAGAIAAVTGIFMALWRLVRLTLPQLVRQDGTLCPHCAYCLIGVESMRCPECGNAFTYEQLETTEAEFLARSVESSTSRSET